MSSTVAGVNCQYRRPYVFAPPQSHHRCNHATRRAHTYIVIAARGRFSTVTLHKCTAYRPPTLSVVQISKSNRREERRGYSVASYAIGRTAATEMLVVCPPIDPPSARNDMTMPRKKSSLFNFHSDLLLLFLPSLLPLSRPHSSFCRLITAPKTMKKAQPYTNNILLARQH